MHFILTRFNIRLWTRDKQNRETRTETWLSERFDLFEKFCLPSVRNQSCGDFQRIVLFDDKTPASYLQRIEHYKEVCRQFIPCMVPAEEARYFVRIFQREIKKRISDNSSKRLITTYLDNDDALRYDYVEKVQKIAETVKDHTFISFKYGLQYFTRYNIATRVDYRNNHFLSLVEPCGESAKIRTVMGYGSHAFVERYQGTHFLLIDTLDDVEWVEVVHEKNMDNDVRMTFNTHLIRNRSILHDDYGVNITLSEKSAFIYRTHFLWHAVSEVFRHVKYRFVERRWV